MRTQYKTQCPRCQTIYPMPNDKLNQPKARANCGKCHHTFFLNSNLIQPDELVIPKPVTTEVNVSAIQTATEPESAPSVTVPAGIISAQEAVANAQKRAIGTPMPTPEPAPIAPQNNSSAHNIDITGAAESIDFDGLDSFLNSDVVVAPKVQKTVDAPIDREAAALIDDLLGDNQHKTAAKEPPKPAPEPKKTTTNSRLKDAMSDIFGTELAKIPTATTNTISAEKKAQQQRTEQRLASQSPSQEKIAKKRGFFGQLMWIVGCLGLLVLMAGQYIIFNTDNIARHPEQAQLVLSICGNISCNLPNADPNAFSSTYELQNGKNNATNLIGTITNDSDEDQLYPNLKVSVYGNNSKILGDFVVTPKDYLTTKQRLLSANQGKRYMFTLPDITPNQISQIKIEPFY